MMPQSMKRAPAAAMIAPVWRAVVGETALQSA
jgi:hypothetical protein